MKPNEIRSLLALHEVRINALAKEHHLSTAVFHQVINNQRPNPRVREILAKAVGKSVAELFPEPSTQEDAA